MLKRIVLYPFLFVVDIVLIPLTVNLDQIDPAQAIKPLILLLVLSGAIMAVLALLLHDWHYAGYLTFLLLSFQFLFGHLWRSVQGFMPSPEVSRWILLGVCGALLVVLGLPWVWKRVGAGRRVTPFFNMVFIILVLTQIFVNLPEILRDGPSRASAKASIELPGEQEPMQIDCSQSPDIYLIVLDAYGRSDVLKKFYGVDNSAFLDSLREKGFYIADSSHTNYIQTVYAIPAILNFEPIKPKPKNVSGKDYFPPLISNSKLARTLQECGYMTIAFESGFYFTNSPIFDVYLTSGSQLTEFENLLLAETPAGLLANQLRINKQGHGYQAHRERVLFAFDQIGKLASNPGPKFIFAHILSPHPPFVFDSQGQPIEPARGYSINDGDDYRGSQEEYHQGYAGQVDFVNKKLESMIDEILANSKTPPVIIVQGDHGPGSQLVWRSPTETCLVERTAILNAYYLPGLPQDVLYPEITPLNSFRVVLNHYFNAGLELLPDMTIFTTQNQARQETNITGFRDSVNNCTPYTP